MSRTADAATAQVWRERLERQEVSGLSVAAFCRREGVSQPSFYHWRKRLRDAGRNPLFVPVQLPPAGASPSGGVAIELPSGAVVRLAADAPAALLSAAIRAAGFAPEGQEADRC